MNAGRSTHGNAPQGRLQLVSGSMFAGKTAHLIRRLREAAARGRRVRAFKHVMDDRYGADHLATHDGDRFEAVAAASPEELLAGAGGAELVAIDEAHFFGAALVPVVRRLLERGVDVAAAGVSHDAWGRPFEPLPELAALAAEVTECLAPCSTCGRPARYTQRLRAVAALHAAGGAGDYEPRCEQHFTPLPLPPKRG